MLKWHILEEEMCGMAGWLEKSFWVVQKQRGQLHTKRLFVDDRVDVYNILPKFQDRIFNIRHDIVFSVSTFVIHIKIGKIQHTTFIIPIFTSSIAFQHMLKHSKAFNSAFQTVIRYYVHKTGFVIILAFCPKLSVLSAFQCHLECQTDHNHANKCSSINPAAFNVQK